MSRKLAFLRSLILLLLLQLPLYCTSKSIKPCQNIELPHDAPLQIDSLPPKPTISAESNDASHEKEFEKNSAVATSESCTTRKAESGDRVLIEYTLKLYKTCDIIEAATVEEISIDVGSGIHHYPTRRIIERQGLKEGIKGMCIGDRRRISAPSSMAFQFNFHRGKETGQIVPPGFSVIWDVELKQILSSPSPSSDDDDDDEPTDALVTFDDAAAAAGKPDSRRDNTHPDPSFLRSIFQAAENIVAVGSPQASRAKLFQTYLMAKDAAEQYPDWGIENKQKIDDLERQVQELSS